MDNSNQIHAMNHSLTMKTICACLIGILIIILWAYTDAPGATTAPDQSRIGKSVRSDPGGSIACHIFFEHNAFSQDETELKLIPRSRRTTRMRMYGQIIFGISYWVNQSFNIIYIIELQHAVDYLAELSTIYQHRVDNLLLSNIGNVSETGSESWIWTVRSACLLRVFARK